MAEKKHVRGRRIVAVALVTAMACAAPARAGLAVRLPTAAETPPLPVPAAVPVPRLPSTVALPRVSTAVAVPTSVPLPRVSTAVAVPTSVPLPRVSTAVPVPTSVPLPRVSTSPGSAGPTAATGRSTSAPAPTGGGSEPAAGSAASGSPRPSASAPATTRGSSASAPITRRAASGSPAPAGRHGIALAGARGAAPAGGSRAARGEVAWSARQTRRLRALVLRARGCLVALPAEQRRVLALRAGLGRPAALSRRGVAAALEISMRRVTRDERSGLRHLRRLLRIGGCPASAGGGFGDPAPQTAVAGHPVPVRYAVDTKDGSAPEGAERSTTVRHGGLGGGGKAPDDVSRAGAAEISAAHSPGRGGDEFGLALLLALIALAALAAARLRREPSAVAPPTSPPPPVEPPTVPPRPRGPRPPDVRG